MNSTNFPRLLADIGGTNARFAWQHANGSALTDVRSYSCAAFVTLEAAIRCYLQDCEHPQASEAAFGIATAITGDWVQMTNHAWGFSIQQLQAALGLQRLVVINDFTALALGLPNVPKEQLLQIGGLAPVEGAPVALLGPGTGLGCGGFLYAGQGMVALAGEGGHVTLAANSVQQEAVLRVLRQGFDHVSAERVLSGPGLVLLYQTLCVLAKTRASLHSPEQVLQFGQEGKDPIAGQALDLFLSFLGSVAGNLALVLGARGGVYLGGGILPRMIDRLAASELREQFEKKGRCRPYLENIPMLLVCSAVSPALQGVGRALD